MKLRVLLVLFLAPLLVAVLPAQTVRVACVGDSITAGGYPGILDGLLPANYEVRNFGVSGATALAAGHGDLPYRSQPEYAAAVAFAPDIVVIKLGTNDSKAENWINRQYFDTDLAAIVTSFYGLSSHPQVFLCAPIPAMGTDYGIAPRVIETEIVPRILQLRGSLAGVRGIDCFSPFLGHPDYYDDRIHPNEAGRQLLAATIHAAVTAPVDTTPPGAPATSSATAPTTTSVLLVWAAASGAPSGYFVYRDGVLVATVRATTFADTGLVPGTYTYSVRAFDAALNLGAAGPAAVVNTLGVTDTTPPTAPTGLAGHGISTSAISLSWTASIDDVGVSSYQICRNGATTPVGTVASPGFTDTSLAAGTTYAYRVSALDAAGNESAHSAEITATTIASGTPVLNVPITIKECAGTGITDYPVSVVIPLPRGAYQTADALRLYNAAGVAVPCQFAVLNRWWATDNSIRHVTAQFQVSPAAFTGAAGSGTQTFHLRTSGDVIPPSRAVTVTESPSLVTVNTGPLRFTVNKGAGFNLFNELWLDANNDGTFAAAERLIAPSAANGGFLVPRTGAGATQNDSARNDISVTVEESGPLRVVLKIQALTNFTSTTNHLHGWAVRLYAYAGKPFVKVDYQLQNSALNAQFAWPLYFEEAGLRLGLSLGGAPSVTIGRGDGTFWQSPVNRGAYLAQEYHNRAAIYARRPRQPRRRPDAHLRQRRGLEGSSTSPVPTAALQPPSATSGRPGPTASRPAPTARSASSSIPPGAVSTSTPAGTTSPPSSARPISTGSRTCSMP
ncbi:MAG: hypothetical protein IPL39_25000 [Opitutaceae bacterium]|nr:hypothetical protein [Opitutaceae bacterium]